VKPERVPDSHVWKGARRVVFNPPDDHNSALLEILPVEGLVDTAADLVPRIHFRIRIEPGDMEKLQELGWFWVVMYGHVVPWSVEFPEWMDWFEIEPEGEE
jgi:hypothetical protein